MPMTPIEKELVDATGISRRVGQPNSTYFEAIARKVNDFDENAWDRLTTKAQRWVAAAIKAIKAGDKIKSFEIEPPQVSLDDAAEEEANAEAADDSAPETEAKEPEPEAAESGEAEQPAKTAEEDWEQAAPPPENKEDESMATKGTGKGKKAPAAKKAAKKAPAKEAPAKKTAKGARKPAQAPAKKVAATKASANEAARRTPVRNGSGKKREIKVSQANMRSTTDGVRARVKIALWKNPNLTLDDLVKKFGKETRGEDYLRYIRTDHLHTMKTGKVAGVLKDLPQFKDL